VAGAAVDDAASAACAKATKGQAKPDPTATINAAVNNPFLISFSTSFRYCPAPAKPDV
jgi:hypothetical protein